MWPSRKVIYFHKHIELVLPRKSIMPHFHPIVRQVDWLINFQQQILHLLFFVYSRNSVTRVQNSGFSITDITLNSVLRLLIVQSRSSKLSHCHESRPKFLRACFRRSRRICQILGHVSRCEDLIWNKFVVLGWYDTISTLSCLLPFIFSWENFWLCHIMLVLNTYPHRRRNFSCIQTINMTSTKDLSGLSAISSTHFVCSTPGRIYLFE